MRLLAIIVLLGFAATAGARETKVPTDKARKPGAASKLRSAPEKAKSGAVRRARSPRQHGKVQIRKRRPRPRAIPRLIQLRRQAKPAGD